MCSRLVVLVSALAVASASNACQQGSIVNMPVNGSPFYWPSTWNENSTAPQLENHQGCSWTVTIPRGYYAKLIMLGSTTDMSSQFQTIDSAGNLIQTSVENMEPYYYPTPKFTIAVQSNEGVNTFGFKIVWKPFPTKYSGMIYGVGMHGYAYNSTSDVNSYTFSAGSQLSFLPLPDNKLNTFSYRSSLVFNGHNLDGSYVTNMYLLAKTHQQYFTPNNVMMVFNVEATPSSNDILFVQDSSYSQDIKQYVPLDCEGSHTCSGTVNGGNQKSAVISVKYGVQELTDIQMEDTAILSVYYGSQSEVTFYKSYSLETIKAALPVKFSGGVMQYIISHGQATLTFNV